MTSVPKLSPLFLRRINVANGVGQDLAILGHQLEEVALRASCGSERVEAAGFSWSGGGWHGRMAALPEGLHDDIARAQGGAAC